MTGLDIENETGDFYGKIIPLVNKSDEMINEIESKYGKLHWNTEKNIYYDNTDLTGHTLRKNQSFFNWYNDDFIGRC